MLNIIITARIVAISAVAVYAALKIANPQKEEKTWTGEM